MPIQPIFENILLNEKKNVIKEKKKVELKTDIPTESVSKILNVNATASLIKVDEENNKITYGGRTLFYVCYEDSDGEIKKNECGSEFLDSLKTDGELNACKIKADADVVKIETDSSGIFLTLIATIEVSFYCSTNKELCLVCGGEDLVCQTEEKTFVKGYGERTSVYPIDEEIELGYAVEEVLFYRAEPIVTAVQCGVGCIICDGEVRFSALLLQKGEKRDIIKETRAFAFRAEIECDEANPSLQATAEAEQKSLKIDLQVDQEKGISIMKASVVLRFTGEALEQKTISVAKDLFSLTEDVKIERAEQEVCSPDSEMVCHLDVKGECVVGGEIKGETLRAIGGEKAFIVSANSTGEKIEVVGLITATAYFLDEEGKFFTRKVEMPFESFSDCVLGEGKDFSLKIKADGADGKITQQNQIELSATLILSICPTTKKKEKYIKSVTPLGKKQINENAISVYIARQGETLWELSKRLNVSPEELEKTNKELSFPLANDERIIIYRQKTAKNEKG